MPKTEPKRHVQPVRFQRVDVAVGQICANPLPGLAMFSTTTTISAMVDARTSNDFFDPARLSKAVDQHSDPNRSALLVRPFGVVCSYGCLDARLTKRSRSPWRRLPGLRRPRGFRK